MKGSVAAAACFLAVIAAVYADTGAPQGIVEGAQPQAHHQQPFQGRPQAQVPYPLRRQQTNPRSRARDAVMGFMRSVMDAGKRFRSMVSERMDAMFARRSSNRRSQQRYNNNVQDQYRRQQQQ